MARAAADLFQRFGFQNVSIERIGAAVGLTGPAVYRHFKGKHDILAHALMNQGELAERICRRTDEQGGHPEEKLRLLLSRFGEMTANGDEATLWRREQRHLDDTQREVLRRHIAASQEVFADRIAAARPGLGVRKARLLALAVLVMYANTPEFRGTLSQDRLLQLQTAMARALIDCELPDPEPGVRPLPEPGRRRPAGRRERILDVAARLFNERGFHNVQMNDVARAAEISTATLYQHVNSKTDVLRAVLERGAQGLHYVTAEALACAATPRQALDALIESYIRQLLGVHGRVMSILTTDLLYLPEQVQAALRESQREYIAEWVAAIEALTEGLTAVDAGVLARAAIGVLTDLASLPVVRQRPGVIAELTAIARAMVLLPGPSDVADLAAAVASATR